MRKSGKSCPHCLYARKTRLEIVRKLKELGFSSATGPGLNYACICSTSLEASSSDQRIIIR